jgi:putative addiction module killer protein
MMTVKQTDIFKKWFSSLKNDKSLQTIITDKMQRIETDGYLGKTKPIVGYRNISEIRIDIGKGYRIYFNVYIQGNEVWFLSGGDKSTQNNDIKVAQRLLEVIQQERGKRK